jgi:hypothetical protein
MDYAESRVYQPGDDVRRLDWRLTARSGELHTKLFQEEREGRLLVVLDTHPSMRFGTRVRFKSVQAARAAAVAGWYAVRAGERVGAMARRQRAAVERLRPNPADACAQGEQFGQRHGGTAIAIGARGYGGHHGSGTRSSRRSITWSLRAPSASAS